MPTPPASSGPTHLPPLRGPGQYQFPLDPNSGLGGKLLYAGEIDPESRNLLYAANIAGAASLAASPDPAALRQAMRDGVIDFFVNSLEEALRILKNEIRKRQTVSVGVAADPTRLVDQMLDRGVLPDLLSRGNYPNPTHRGDS
jgi:urocanate hydratase